jgi:hypothetical protein
MTRLRDLAADPDLLRAEAKRLHALADRDGMPKAHQARFYADTLDGIADAIEEMSPAAHADFLDMLDPLTRH